jgi:hypothetical protein
MSVADDLRRALGGGAVFDVGAGKQRWLQAEERYWDAVRQSFREEVWEENEEGQYERAEWARGRVRSEYDPYAKRRMP